MSNKIWWLASFPKSGNTWLRLFLSAYIFEQVDINKPRVNTSDTQPYFWQAVCPRPYLELTKPEIAAIRPAALLALASLIGIKPVFVKTHSACCTVCAIPQIPTPVTEGAVYLVRDPRDVAVSLAEHLNEPIEVTIAAMGSDTWSLVPDDAIFQEVMSWRTNVKSWMSQTFPVLTVRYEDLISDPVEYFGRIVQHVGMTANKERVQRSLELCAFEELQRQEREYGFREAKRPSHVFFKRGKAGGWRERLNAEQVRRIEYDHGEVMQKLGYELSTEA